MSPNTDPVPSCINQYRLLLTQHHQILTPFAFYWPSIIMYQPVPPSTDPVPLYINQYQPILLLLGDYRPLHSLPRVLFLSRFEGICLWPRVGRKETAFCPEFDNNNLSFGTKGTCLFFKRVFWRAPLACSWDCHGPRGVLTRVCHLQFFLISLLFQAGIYPRHTKEQEKYRSYMVYVYIFQRFLTFVLYKLHITITRGKWPK